MGKRSFPTVGHDLISVGRWAPLVIATLACLAGDFCFAEEGQSAATQGTTGKPNSMAPKELLAVADAILATEITPENSLAPLAHLVLRHPDVQVCPVARKFVKDFSLADKAPEDFWDYELSTHVGNIRKVVFIFPRKSGRTDMFFVVQTPLDKIKKGNSYYRTTLDGKLIRATYTGGGIIEVIPNDKAQEGFEAEVAYWKKWMEQSKTAAAPTPK